MAGTDVGIDLGTASIGGPADYYAEPDMSRI